MVDSAEQLEKDFGRDWTFGRTHLDGRPHWWMATRRRRLSMDEMRRGLSPSLVYDTEPLMRTALTEQSTLEARVRATPTPPRTESPRAAAWNPAYL